MTTTMDEHKQLAHGHSYIMERTRVRTEKTRVKGGPENLMKVNLDGINEHFARLP